jgi:hypothetical protein
MTYSELIQVLNQIEKQTGLYLSDTCVDAENAGKNSTDAQLYDVAICVAEQRASDAGFDIYKLLKAE